MSFHDLSRFSENEDALSLSGKAFFIRYSYRIILNLFLYAILFLLSSFACLTSIDSHIFWEYLSYFSKYDVCEWRWLIALHLKIILTLKYEKRSASLRRWTLSPLTSEVQDIFHVYSDYRFCKYETSSERLSIVPLTMYFHVFSADLHNTYRSSSYVIVVSCLFTFFCSVDGVMLNF